MRSTHASPKRRRPGRTPVALPAALVLLAGVAQAIAPASAAAMDGQDTGTGSTCIERSPSVFIDSVTQEKCEPVQLPGETVIVRDPFKAPEPAPPRLPACSALVHKCGLPEEGRVPQRKPSEKDSGSEPGRGRGSGAVAKETPNARRQHECRSLWTRLLEPVQLYTGKARALQDRANADRETIEFLRRQISKRIANLFRTKDEASDSEETDPFRLEDPFAWGIREISKLRSRAQELMKEVQSLDSESDSLAKAEMRAKFNEQCRWIMF
jgi:hypothetical protein